MKLRTLVCLAAALTFTSIAVLPASAGRQIFYHQRGNTHIAPINVNQPAQDSPENWETPGGNENVVIKKPGDTNNPGDMNDDSNGGNAHAAPSPAALPAGLMALGFLAARRRHQADRE